MTVHDIVLEYLKANGYDGLWREQCSCKLGSLMDCDMEGIEDCQAGHLVPCNPEQCDDPEWCKMGHGYHIGRKE